MAMVEADFEAAYKGRDGKKCQQILRQLMEYDEDEGYFYWKQRPVPAAGPKRRTVKSWNARFPGTLAGHMRERNRNKGCTDYWSIDIASKPYLCHVLVMLHTDGKFAPDGMSVDHIDRDGLNNSRGNLRFADNALQTYNRDVRRTSVSRVTGVYYDNERQSTWLT